ncbi:hypothetical protein [Hyphococcus luteus]|uniref:Uncharacterized protein n=1 Tax=Hyphococcus luteus TaxID=2058213 RepID=A0A2S7K785_9PROT|nr:hypothetical protein [Marinicaulis flavus]PQA88342.1 hypothetical protein CW354_08565 [Marinicaulis flavus]
MILAQVVMTHDRKYLPLFEVLDTEVRRREESAARISEVARSAVAGRGLRRRKRRKNLADARRKPAQSQQKPDDRLASKN